jgi:hypothetical protein
MWIEHVLNQKTLTSIYPTKAPSLAQVRLHELAILCGNDLQCRLQFDLHDFPVDAPAKWVQFRPPLTTVLFQAEAASAI